MDQSFELVEYCRATDIRPSNRCSPMAADHGRVEKLDAGSEIPAGERTGSDPRTLLENDGSVRSLPIDQAALFRDAPSAPIRGRPKKTLGKKGSLD
ncbi:hypothetical protein LSAT2_006421 [Lamellibrachia satsuma]|nr:hypothetical protein LSAT2_006421 [Lamellibrachia satsuma]